MKIKNKNLLEIHTKKYKKKNLKRLSHYLNNRNQNMIKIFLFKILIKNLNLVMKIFNKELMMKLSLVKIMRFYKVLKIH